MMDLPSVLQMPEEDARELAEAFPPKPWDQLVAEIADDVVRGREMQRSIDAATWRFMRRQTLRRRGYVGFRGVRLKAKR